MKNIIYIIRLTIIAVFANTALAAQKTLPSCISKHYGNKPISAERIKIKAPNIAENGAVVGVGVQTIEGLKRGEFVKEISFYNEFRKEPIATFFLSDKMKSDNLKTRIRLRESSNLYAVAKLDTGELIGGQSFIKVTIGGCGGGGALNALGKAPRVCTQQ